MEIRESIVSKTERGGSILREIWTGHEGEDRTRERKVFFWIKRAYMNPLVLKPRLNANSQTEQVSPERPRLPIRAYAFVSHRQL